MASQEVDHVSDLLCLIKSTEYENSQQLQFIEQEREKIEFLKTEYEEHLKGINQCARSSVQAEEGIQLKCNKFTQLKENFESLKHTSLVLEEHKTALQRKMDFKKEEFELKRNRHNKLLAKYKATWERYEAKYKEKPSVAIVEGQKKKNEEIKSKVQKQKNEIEELNKKIANLQLHCKPFSEFPKKQLFAEIISLSNLYIKREVLLKEESRFHEELKRYTLEIESLEEPSSKLQDTPQEFMISKEVIPIPERQCIPSAPISEVVPSCTKYSYVEKAPDKVRDTSKDSNSQQLVCDQLICPASDQNQSSNSNQNGGPKKTPGTPLRGKRGTSAALTFDIPAVFSPLQSLRTPSSPLTQAPPVSDISARSLTKAKNSYILAAKRPTTPLHSGKQAISPPCFTVPLAPRPKIPKPHLSAPHISSKKLSKTSNGATIPNSNYSPTPLSASILKAVSNHSSEISKCSAAASILKPTSSQKSLPVHSSIKSPAISLVSPSCTPTCQVVSFKHPEPLLPDASKTRSFAQNVSPLHGDQGEEMASITEMTTTDSVAVTSPCKQGRISKSLGVKNTLQNLSTDHFSGRATSFTNSDSNSAEQELATPCNVTNEISTEEINNQTHFVKVSNTESAITLPSAESSFSQIAGNVHDINFMKQLEEKNESESLNFIFPSNSQTPSISNEEGGEKSFMFSGFDAPAQNSYSGTIFSFGEINCSQGQGNEHEGSYSFLEGGHSMEGTKKDNPGQPQDGFFNFQSSPQSLAESASTDYKGFIF